MSAFQEAGSRADFCAEVLGHGLSDVGKRGAHSQVDGFRPAGPINQQRHVLAAMIGGRRSGVAAVIGRDDQQVLRRQLPVKRGKPGVELVERFGVSFDIVAMAVKLIEIDQVHK